MIFSEQSSRIIHELCNNELYEFGQMSSTTLCQSCFKHVLEDQHFVYVECVFDLTKQQ